ncbi:DUF5696 domain-containing protein [Paenibacillus sp. GCM10027629]|uniref:DUF5696 domain-containing protein n=1 Tax=Paenibacillus sp. GCM10027629 TaxID=3273414 RepID=UPI00363F25FD
MRLFRSKKLLLSVTACIISVLTVVGLIFAASGSDSQSKQQSAEQSSEPSTAQQATVKPASVKVAAAGTPVASGLPDERTFKPLVENQRLQLKVDASTGHFLVVNKQTGDVWRSFPNPKNWKEKSNTAAWKDHLASPFMFRYVEFNIRKDLLKESNLIAQKGTVSQFEATEHGFKIQYELPELGFSIPVEVTLGDDFVETKVLSEGLKDERVYTAEELKTKKKDPLARLVSIRLFPFLGAQTSDEENGFLLIPDGSGALIDFKKYRAGTQNLYTERVYGDDWAYSNRNIMSDRKAIKMPFFGIKSANQAMVGVIREGDDYANVVAAPSGSFSQYNWATAEFEYRFKFFQPTDTKKKNGYLMYSKEITKSDRSVRYYFIDQPEVDYAQMADRYRQYLIDEQGLKPLQGKNADMKLQLHILGADTETGFLWDSYLPLTTTAEAKEIVQELGALGVDDMSITYLGWQNGGFSKFGGAFPVGSKIGGNEGMQQFIDFAHTSGFPVYMDASSYTFNNTGKDGFRVKRDGLRDLGSSVIEFNSWDDQRTTFVSPKFMQKVIQDDLQDAKDLMVDGYMYGQGVGNQLNTDYNEDHKVSREESMHIQQEIMNQTKQSLGNVQVADGNLYTLPYVNHMHNMFASNSYDLFVDRAIPFTQMVLHGLVTYSFDYANLSDDYEESFLKGIEYGAVPSYIVTYAKPEELLKSLHLDRFYSTYYKDWIQEIVSQYQRYTEALGDVQGEFIENHRELAHGVFETTYAHGKRIIVNYNETPYNLDTQHVVKARDFIVIKGGA